MKNQSFTICLIVLCLVVTSHVGFAQLQRGETLMKNGRAEQADIIRVDSRRYVDVEALARILNASLIVNGTRIILNLPEQVVCSEATSSATEREGLAGNLGLSRDFMRAGIEEIATLREWASTVAYAIQNNYHVTEEWAAKYREQAASNLRLASATASGEGDRNALRLLTNEFEAVSEWNNRLIQERQSMDTAKYALSQSALRDAPMSQKIISCGRFLAQMLGSASFQDDGSCH